MITTEKQLDRQDAIEIKNFTRVPNMLIFGYHDTLSPQEKWLLVCLKHLCGKKGTRHLSLRYISEQTGISTGALSASKDKKGRVNEGMIKHLHNAGFIHAEVKKFQGKGNPQYHITITDVWELNQAFFDKTRSDFGQDEEEDVEPVRNSDDPVQISDKLVQISDEPVRNSANTNIRYKTITNTREQEESTDASAIAPAAPTPLSSQAEEAEQVHIALTAPKASVPEIEDVPPDENNSHSHGEVTQANSVAPVVSARADELPPVVRPPVPQVSPPVLKDDILNVASTNTQKRTRKAKGELDADVQKKIDAICEVLSKLKQAVMDDPEARYVGTQKDIDAFVKTLLPQKPTPARLRKVFLSMWNESNRDGTHFWRNHMTGHNIAMQYESRVMGIEGKAPTLPPEERPLTAYERAGYEDYTHKGGDKPLVFRKLAGARPGGGR